MNHEITWEEREACDLMLGKMCWKERNVNFERDAWEDVNCPHNERREKDVLEKFK